MFRGFQFSAVVSFLGILTSSVLAEPVPASFPCEQAKLDVEKEICASSELSELDFDINYYYRKIVARSDEHFREAIKNNQIRFINHRNNTKDNINRAGTYVLLEFRRDFLHGVFELMKSDYKFFDKTQSSGAPTIDTNYDFENGGQIMKFDKNDAGEYTVEVADIYVDGILSCIGPLKLYFSDGIFYSNPKEEYMVIVFPRINMGFIIRY